MLSLPQPGFPRPVEYFSMSGMNARSCAWVIFSTGVGIPSITRGGNSYRVGSVAGAGGACWARAVSSSFMITDRKFFSTSSNGLAPNDLICKMRFYLLSSIMADMEDDGVVYRPT